MTGGVTATAGLGLYHLHKALEAARCAGERVLEATVDLVETASHASGLLVVVAGKRVQNVLVEAVEIGKYLLFILMLASYAPPLVDAIDKAIRVWRRAQKDKMFDCGQNPEANIPQLELWIPKESKLLDFARHPTWRVAGSAELLLT